MKKNNLIRFIQSLVILPAMAVPVVFGVPYNAGIYHGIAQNVLAQKFNIKANGAITLNQAVDPAVALQKIKVDAIDAYFKKRGMPLHGMGMTMVLEAEKNDLDWRILAAIAVRESTGGKFECKKVENNAFGWGSCKIGFKSNEEAIATVAQNLGGNNPKTARHYNNKTTLQILRAYNPPYVVPRYAEQVISIMNSIGAENVTPDTPASSSDLLAQRG